MKSINQSIKTYIAPSVESKSEVYNGRDLAECAFSLKGKTYKSKSLLKRFYQLFGFHENFATCISE